MNKILLVVVFIASVLQGRSQEVQVRAVVDKMFSSMLKKDTSALRQCFIPGVQLMTYAHDSKGNYMAKYATIYDF